jgi:excisionase family DNA binding protein
MAKQRSKRPEAAEKVMVNTAEEVAVMLRTGRNQLYEALQAGKIKGAFRFGRKWIIPAAVVDRLLKGEITITS